MCDFLFPWFYLCIVHLLNARAHVSRLEQFLYRCMLARCGLCSKKMMATKNIRNIMIIITMTTRQQSIDTNYKPITTNTVCFLGPVWVGVGLGWALGRGVWELHRQPVYSALALFIHCCTTLEELSRLSTSCWNSNFWMKAIKIMNPPVGI